MAPLAEVARAHPGGVVDLSVGTPVDPTPEVVQRALRVATDASGYPLTAGTPKLRAAIVGHLERQHGVDGLDLTAVLPTIGSKELIAWLPVMLGLGPGDTVGFPALAYPTYDIGARLVGAHPVPLEGLSRADGSDGSGDLSGVRLLWLNSPSNPTGAVLLPERMRALVAQARAHGAVVASDECYLDFGWEAQPTSVLHPAVCGGSHEGLLAVRSLSKRSNMAGYRAGFVAGDPALVRELLAVRRHAGALVPAPVQEAMVAALGDDAHVAEQRERYAGRRARLLPALCSAGFRVDESEAGLYLWATRGEACWQSVRWLAERGVLVAPGEFYGAAGRRHVRVALTATDERVASAVERLGG